jgi:hypothetical protein
MRILTRHAKNSDAAKALLRFFAAPDTLEVIQAKGMGPQ